MTHIQADIFNNPQTFKEFFDNAHDLIHIVDPDGKIIYVNKSWKTLLNYDLEEVQGASIYSFVSTEDREAFITYRQDVIRGEQHRQVTIALINKDGNKVYVEGFVSPKVIQGKVIYTSGIFRDVTARFHNERQLMLINAELKERETSLSQLLFNAPDAVIVANTESIIMYWNPKAETIFGWRQEEVMGKSLAELIIPDRYREAHRAGMERYLQTGTAKVLNRTIEISAINKAGKEFFVSLTISTTLHKGQTGFIAFIRDIDQQKRIEAELEQKRLQLELSNQELEQFAHVASHDMKEPVRKIRIFLERLKSEIGDALSENVGMYINKIDAAATNITKMVEGVLVYASLREQEFVIEKVNLNEVIMDIENDLDILLQEKDGIIEYKDLPVVDGSAFLLYQLFLNLINNSLKFAKPDVRPVIQITAARDRVNSLTEIKINDNGIGFAQEYSQKIFDTFTRLHGKSKFEGTGLGLSICKRIVEKHNGTITAFGKENSGATFIIRLPDALPTSG